MSMAKTLRIKRQKDIEKSEGKSEEIKGYVRILIFYEQNHFPSDFHIVVMYHVPKSSS